MWSMRWMSAGGPDAANKIGDAGAEALGRMLEKNEALQQLDLYREPRLSLLFLRLMACFFIPSGGRPGSCIDTLGRLERRGKE